MFFSILYLTVFGFIICSIFSFMLAGITWLVNKELIIIMLGNIVGGMPVNFLMYFKTTFIVFLIIYWVEKLWHISVLDAMAESLKNTNGGNK